MNTPDTRSFTSGPLNAAMATQVVFQQFAGWSIRLVLLGALLATTACSSSKSRVGGVLNLDTDLKLSFVTANDVNPDHSDKPSPIIVRLYELKSTTGFDKADFVDIYERDQELLGAELIGKQNLQPLVPGEERQEVLVLSPGTTHVGLYAEFSQYLGASYKLAVPVTQNNVIRNSIRVEISANQLKLLQ